MTAQIFLLALLATQTPGTVESQSLVGSWGPEIFSFDADGTGVMKENGSKIQWEVRGGALLIRVESEVDTVPLRLDGNLLHLGEGQKAMTLSRLAPPGAKTAPVGEAGKSALPPLRELLTSSPWCTFNYDRERGFTLSERNRFLANGKLEGVTKAAPGDPAAKDQSYVTEWWVENGAVHIRRPTDKNRIIFLTASTMKRRDGTPVVVLANTDYLPCP